MGKYVETGLKIRCRIFNQDLVLKNALELVFQKVGLEQNLSDRQQKELACFLHGEGVQTVLSLHLEIGVFRIS